jgi:hypothetical protein
MKLFTSTWELHCLILNVLLPIMHILKSQNLSDLAITERRLILSHLARHLGSRIVLCQEILRLLPDRNCVIRGIEDLKAKPVLLDRQITNLPQVTGINVRPRIALTACRV